MAFCSVLGQSYLVYKRCATMGGVQGRRGLDGLCRNGRGYKTACRAVHVLGLAVGGRWGFGSLFCAEL